MIEAQRVSEHYSKAADYCDMEDLMAGAKEIELEWNEFLGYPEPVDEGAADVYQSAYQPGCSITGWKVEGQVLLRHTVDIYER